MPGNFIAAETLQALPLPPWIWNLDRVSLQVPTLHLPGCCRYTYHWLRLVIFFCLLLSLTVSLNPTIGPLSILHPSGVPSNERGTPRPQPSRLTVEPFTDIHPQTISHGRGKGSCFLIWTIVLLETLSSDCCSS